MTKLISFKATDGFEKELRRIEDFIFNVRGEITDVEKFLDELQAITIFIRSNPNTPSIDPKTGDHSWPFGDGKYRIFYTVLDDTVFLTDIIANKAANLDRYPEHKIDDEDTFTTDE